MDHVASPHPTQAAASFLDRILAERKRLERALAAVGDLIVIYEAIAAGRPASVAPPIQEVPAAAQAPKEKPTISPERAEAPVDPLQKFYPERNEIIKREWPKGTPTPEILAMLHALPGAQINARLLYIKAGKLGVHRAPSAPKATPAPDTAVDLSPLLSIATATERKRPEFDPPGKTLTLHHMAQRCVGCCHPGRSLRIGEDGINKAQHRLGRAERHVQRHVAPFLAALLHPRAGACAPERGNTGRRPNP